MKRNWQESKFDRVIGRWGALYATLNPAGHLFITRRTYELLGAPVAFQLLFDRVNATIGMKPAGRDAKNAYPALRRSGHGGRVLRAFNFLEEFGIKLNETVRFASPEIDEDRILVLDLRKVTPAAKPKRMTAAVGA